MHERTPLLNQNLEVNIHTPLLNNDLESNKVNVIKTYNVCINILIFFFACFLYLLLTSIAASINISTKTKIIQHHDVYYHIEEPNVIAEYYENNNSTGWGILKINTAEKMKSSNVSAYYAGYLEGYLSAKVINIMWINIQDTLVYPQITQYIEENLIYMKGMINKHSNNEYWMNINYYLIYLKGLHQGYDDKYPGHLSFLNILSFQYQSLSQDMGLTSCSALIRIVNNDILYGHATWYNYNTMLRIYKDIRLPFLNITYSGYPGTFASTDDFYINSKGLIVMETSLNLYNFNYSTQNVPVSFRSIYATHKSLTSSEWCDNFSKYNDGMYNNQWLIMDSNKQFFLLEQSPKLILYKNLTPLLLKQKFFIGYNVPYFKEMYEQLSDYNKDDANNDNRYELTLTLIDRVHNFDDMKWFMRYNNYTHDIHTNYNPIRSIAARYDLLEDKQAYGTIDAKITSYNLLIDRNAYIISKLPDIEFYTFNWDDEKWKNISHVGLVDTSNFDWLYV
jgi:hypothetical protein